MKVFSKKRFVKSCKEAGATPFEIINALKYWADELDGKSEEEVNLRKLKLEEDWFISEEEMFDDEF